MQVPQDVLRAIGIHHRRALGDLDQHVRGIDTAVDDAAQDPLGEVGLPELPRGEVEADLEVDVELAPGLGLVDELSHHPVPDQLDETELLRERDELDRRHHRAVGLDPSDQGLDADHAAGGELDDRLVVQRPPLTVDGLAQPRHELQLRAGIECPVRRDGVAGGTVLLRLVHRRFRVALQRVRVVGVLREQADAHAHRDVELGALHRDRARASRPARAGPPPRPARWRSRSRRPRRARGRRSAAGTGRRRGGRRGRSRARPRAAGRPPP